MLRFIFSFGALVCMCGAVQAQSSPREVKVRNDWLKVNGDGFWIYNDLKQGFEQAASQQKPLLVVLRCIPCEECVKLDDELVEQDPAIRSLLEQFVCVRQVSTNGLDLSTFQFDTDQSFAVFMLHADGTILGRYGTRSHRTEWNGDVALAGLAAALRGALDLHAKYPQVKDQLAAKRGPVPEYRTPESYPSLRDRPASLDFAGTVVVKNCIHCHQIGDAQRELVRSAGAFPDEVFFPYPHPKSLGLILDPETRATVKDVQPDSVAQRAGFAVGDEVIRMNGQPLLSIADVQWVLQGIPASGGEVRAEVVRQGKMVPLTVTLDAGWRRAGEMNWRVSAWGMRRMATGGVVSEPLSQEQRQQRNLADDKMALRVKHVGQFGPHAAAKKAGVKVDDVIVQVGTRDDLMREDDMLLYSLNEFRPGETIPFTLLRDGKRIEVKIPAQP